MELIKWVYYYVVEVFIEDTIIKYISILFSLVISTIIGHEIILVNIMVVLYIFDFGTGLLNAKQKKELTSKGFIRGAFKLITYFMLLFIGGAIDEVLHSGQILYTSIITFIILTDSISILENLHDMGYNVPYFLVKYLKLAKSKVDKSLISSYADNSSDLIRVKDKYGRYIFINDAMASYMKNKNWKCNLGKTSIECFGKELGSLLEYSDKIAIDNYKKRGQKTTRIIERGNVAGLGEKRLDVKKTIIEDENGFAGYTGHARDLSMLDTQYLINITKGKQFVEVNEDFIY